MSVVPGVYSGTCYGRKTGEGPSGCDLHTDHVQTAGQQRREVVAVVGGRVHTDGREPVGVSAVQRDRVTVGGDSAVHCPGKQQHRCSSGLQP